MSRHYRAYGISLKFREVYCCVCRKFARLHTHTKQESDAADLMNDDAIRGFVQSVAIQGEM